MKGGKREEKNLTYSVSLNLFDVCRTGRRCGLEIVSGMFCLPSSC